MLPTHGPLFGHDFGRISIDSPAAGATRTKLAINQPGDEYEQEADRVADRVMRMPEQQGHVACACGGQCRKCQTEHAGQVQKQLRTRRAGPGALGQTTAPPIVHEVLDSPGQPLDTATRAFLAPHFGLDFSRVRIHNDAMAADSAQAVNALAYTVGRNVVFGAGQFQPGTASGRRLLAHEIAHVAQQNEGPVTSLQRACRSAAQCSAPTQGNPGQVGVTAAAEQAVLESGPDPCQAKARHKGPATNVTALVTGAGLGVTIPPEVHGIFINACLPESIESQRTDCGDFPGGAPTGAPAAKSCVGVRASDEDAAKAILAKPVPSAADKATVLGLASTIKHESQHASFNAAASGVVPPAADCNLGTVVHFPGGTDTVKHLLSEMSAETAEFDVFFRNTKSSPGKVSAWAMQTEEHDIASRSGENILGIIKTLQCACACDTVDTFTEKVFNNVATSWTTDEKTEFQKAMTGFIPSFWPKSLHKT
jgi:Domain of unknown function (DUF4157)